MAFFRSLLELRVKAQTKPRRASIGALPSVGCVGIPLPRIYRRPFLFGSIHKDAIGAVALIWSDVTIVTGLDSLFCRQRTIRV